MLQAKGSQPFQARDPIKQTEGPWPTDCTTAPMRQMLHMHKTEIKTTENNI